MTFEDVVSELVAVTGIDAAGLREKVWREALRAGSNVRDEALAFGLDFHDYSEKMEAFYRESVSFVIETVVESCRPGKQVVVTGLCERVRAAIARLGGQRPRILMLGDGSASDSIALHRVFGDSIQLHYFDVPGSRTFEFARRRLTRHAVPVIFIDDYAKIPEAHFDLLVSFEVLEHLPDPCAAIAGMASFLKPGGVCLVTESFNGVTSYFPTHLRNNRKYAGHTPHLFLDRNLLLTWSNPDPLVPGRPMEFTRIPRVTFAVRWRLQRVLDGSRSPAVSLAKIVLRALGRGPSC